MQKIRVGVIGCGYWGPKLARNIHEIPEAQLAAVFRIAHVGDLACASASAPAAPGR